ncbi:adenine phosphoribosyltransferase-like [Tropilaelaps mercedesae]|uniref:adenine phosphoribosyltransferase n=1 Tax=Tropilaelaps mercedesae TaxID=418985 RepID=A0A1V9XAJ8_9ACAR|nr:adenine phosphoribosyltransferase-like [Tropilaelaps mercedesae]
MDRVKDLVATFSDFPKKGVQFRDIMPVFRDPQAYAALLTELERQITPLASDCAGLIGVESRGFLLAAPLAARMGLPFIPVRKPGKLPGNTYRRSFDLEYGKDVLEVQVDSIEKGRSYVILDDLLATGGTLRAACDLIQDCGATVISRGYPLHRL